MNRRDPESFIKLENIERYDSIKEMADTDLICVIHIARHVNRRQSIYIIKNFCYICGMEGTG